jgi:hypothetical protein
MRFVRRLFLFICAAAACAAFANVGHSASGGIGVTELLLGVPKACTGCCSSHGGVSSSCRSGRIVCNDGTTSQSCACGSCTTSPPPPPSTCSYSYSTWSACQPSNIQTRSVVGSSPSGCVGTPILSQQCTYAPPACVYAYSGWSACQPNNTQSRTIISVTPSGCTGAPQLLTQACTYVAPQPPPSAVNYTSLWWNPSESGWGLNVNHQDSTLFVTLFTYASSGAPMWLVASGMPLQSDGSYSGALYRVAGPAFNKTPWTGTVTATQVGAITLRFSGEGAGTVTYNVGSTTVSKPIEKQIFGTAPVCSATSSSRQSATNYQDLWWNSSESGWGVNLTHQGNTIFATLFTFDGAGNDLWLVASSLTKQSDGGFAGALYATTGPAFNATPWGAVKATEMGNMALHFTNGELATLSYTFNGAAVTKTIQRQVFGATAPMCR